ncbi:hypothetical protein ACVOMV_29400 [Mesorhizobium atlanticum]
MRRGLDRAPAHHFEWASLLVDFAARSGQNELAAFARQLHARRRCQRPQLAHRASPMARSLRGVCRWIRSPRGRCRPKCDQGGDRAERLGGPDLPSPRSRRASAAVFRWHIDPAPLGLWIDRIDERGRSLATEVPASIFTIWSVR